MNQSHMNDDLKQFDRMLHVGGAAVTVAVAVLIYFAAYAPLSRRHTAVLQRAASFDELLNRETQVRTDHANLSESLSEIKNRTEALHRRVPREPREVEFLMQVTEVANDEGLEIREYVFGAISKKRGYSQMEMTLIGDGTYHSICGFLDRVHRLPRLSNVAKMEVTADAQNDSYPINLTLVIYFDLIDMVTDGEQATHG